MSDQLFKNSNNWNFTSLAATRTERLAPCQVLVVEDDLCLLPVMTSILTKIHPEARVDWRTSVDQVLIDIKMSWRKLRAYDLIIADVFLPGTYNGLELWRHCRFNCPNVPFLIVSSMPSLDYQKVMATQGMHPNFLAKPVQPQTCMKMIQKLLPHSPMMLP